MSSILLFVLVVGLAYGVLKARKTTYTIPFLKINVGPATSAPASVAPATPAK